MLRSTWETWRDAYECKTDLSPRARALAAIEDGNPGADHNNVERIQVIA